MSFADLVEAIRTSGRVLAEVAGHSEHPDRVAAVASEVAGCFAADSEEALLVSAMEVECWILPLLGGLGRLVGEILASGRHAKGGTSTSISKSGGASRSVASGSISSRDAAARSTSSHA